MSLFAATAGVANSVLPTTAAIAAAAIAPRAAPVRLFDAQTTSSTPLPVVAHRRARLMRGEAIRPLWRAASLFGIFGAGEKHWEPARRRRRRERCGIDAPARLGR